jgi:hypothetical protein
MAAVTRRQWHTLKEAFDVLLPSFGNTRGPLVDIVSLRSNGRYRPVNGNGELRDGERTGRRPHWNQRRSDVEAAHARPPFACGEPL